MRDPKRIPMIISMLEEAWQANPDLRFGQLLCNIFGDLLKNESKFYHTEDEELAKYLMRYVSDYVKDMEDEKIKELREWADESSKQGKIKRIESFKLTMDVMKKFTDVIRSEANKQDITEKQLIDDLFRLRKERRMQSE